MTNSWSTFIGRLRAGWRSLTARKSLKGQPRRRPALELLEDRAVPATFNVSLTGSDVTGDGSVATPFRTVQAGINAAALTADGNDFVKVATGNYNEAGVDLAITIPSKANLTNLQLLGGWDATFATKDPTATPSVYVFQNDASLSGDLNILDSNVTISGFTWVFDGQAGAGATRTGSAGIVVQATDTVITNNQFEVSPRGATGFRPTAIQTASTDLTGLRITDNKFTFDALTPNSASAAVGIFINPDAGGRTMPLVIDGNTFTGDNLGSAIVIKTTSNVEFTNNSVTRTGSSNTFLSLIDLRQMGANQTGIKIDSNDLINLSAKATVGAGISTNGDTFGSPTYTLAATFTNNNITGNAIGIAVDSMAGSDVVAQSNALAGNTTGVSKSGTSVVDFAGNWWGSASGPTVASNPGGTGASIADPSGLVDYSPWLTTGDDVSAAPGFQGDFSKLTVNASSPRHDGQTTGNLQEGIDQVTAGGTVNVLEGTYDVSAGVTIDKQLTLAGARRGVSGNAASRGTAESVLMGSASTTQGVFNFDTTAPVTIDGFTIDTTVIGTGTPTGTDLRFLNNVFNLQANSTPGGTSLNINTLTRFTLTNNSFTTTGSTGDGGAVIQVAGNYAGSMADTTDFMDVTGNTFKGIPDASGQSALQLNFSSVQGIVQNNTFDGVDIGILVANSSGNLTIDHNTFENLTRGATRIASGSYGGGVVFFNPTLSAPVTISNNTFQNSDTGIRTSFGGGGPFTLDSTTVALTGNTFTGNLYDVVDKFAGTLMPTGDNVFDGVTLSAATDAQLFAIEDKIVDAIDVSGYGLVVLKAGNRYVTPNSFYALGGTTAASIQRALDAAASGDVVNVAAGAYAGDVSTDGKAVTLSPGGSGLATVTVNGNLTLDNDDALAVTIGGSSAGAFDTLAVNGTVALNGAMLQLNGTFTPASATTFTVFANDGTDAVQGTFAGLPEGATLAVNGIAYAISYAGDGNDVTLSTVPATLSGAVVFDANRNGVADAGERGVAGLVVFADANGNGLLDAGESSAVTDAQGRYLLDGLIEGRAYSVRLVAPSDFALTGPAGKAAAASPDGMGPIFTGVPFLNSAPVFVTAQAAPSDPDGARAFVLGLYQDLLGRDGGGDAGVDHWAGLLHGGAARAEVVKAIVNSVEYRGRQVDHFYQAFLGREADEAGRAGHVAFLLNGGTEEELAVSFLTAAECQARFPDNASFVAGLYGGLLGRGPSQDEAAGWVKALSAGVPRADVVRGFLDSREASLRALDGFYAAFLGREIDPSGQANFSGMMQQRGGNAIDAMLAILSSDEYRGIHAA